MKRKYAALMLGLTLAVSSAACAEEAADTVGTELNAAAEMKEEEMLLGKITAIDGDEITVALGTMRAEKSSDTEDQSTEEASEAGKAEAAEADAEEEKTAGADAEAMDAADMLELTGETQVITITDETQFYQEVLPEREDGELEVTLEEDEASANSQETRVAEAEQTDDAAEGAELSEEAAEKDEEKDEFGTELSEELLQTITLEDLKEGDVIKFAAEEDGTGTIIIAVAAETPEENVLVMAEEADTENTDE